MTEPCTSLPNAPTWVWEQCWCGRCSCRCLLLPFSVLCRSWLGEAHAWQPASLQPPPFSLQSRSAMSMTVMARMDSWEQVSGRVEP